MFIFNGETKKRNVNMGRFLKKENNDFDNIDYLQQLKIKKKEREKKRQIEKKVKILQKSFKKYLENDFRVHQIKNQWLEKTSIDNEDEMSIVIYQFWIMCKKLFVHQNLIDSINQIKFMHKKFQFYQIYFNEKSRKIFFKSTIKICEFLIDQTELSSENLDDNFNLVFDFFTYLTDNEENYDYTNVSELTSLFNYFVSKRQITNTSLSKTLKHKIINLILNFNRKKYSNEAFVKFFSIPDLFIENISDNILHDKNLISEIIEKSSCLNCLNEIDNFNFFINYLSLIHNVEVYTLNDYIIISKAIKNIFYQIKNINDYEPNDVSDIKFENEKTLFLKDNFLYVNQSLIDRFLVLYSSKFVNINFFLFQNKSNLKRCLDESVIEIVLKLMIIYPSLKTKLCMLITLLSNSYKIIFNQLIFDPIFQFIMKKIDDEKLDMFNINQLKDFYNSFFDKDSILYFLKLLFIFNELYSYWIIICNDYEMFDDDKLSNDDIVIYMKILKFLCLTLIFCHRLESEKINPPIINNGTKINFETNIKKFETTKKNVFNDEMFELFLYHFFNLKTTSILLLNQLYIRDLRMKFVNPMFWRTDGININIDELINYINQKNKFSDYLIYENDSQDFRSITNNYLFNTNDNVKNIKNHNPKENDDLVSKYKVTKELSFFIDFRDRVKIFQSLINFDKLSINSDYLFFFNFSNKLKANIKRDNILEDAFNQLHKCGPVLKFQIQIIFYNEHGQEAGIDGGGITKEFLTGIISEAFDSKNKLRLFSQSNNENFFYPNSDIYMKLTKEIDVEEQKKKLLYLKFIGNIVGKCLYENVLIDISFASFFLNKWCNMCMKNSINDLNYFDEELFINLMKLTKMSESELNDLDLDFTINEKIKNKIYSFNLNSSKEKNTSVNINNRLNYIHQISNFKLNSSLNIQTSFFLKGLFEIIPKNWLSMFDSSELQMLISGEQNDVDIEDWKNNVEYGGYYPDQLTIIYFWEVVSEMTANEKSKLINFVTSVRRAPLMGFEALVPKFGIRNSGTDINRLPTASTCINLLKLPDYKNKELIKSKLLYAINIKAGFDLS